MIILSLECSAVSCSTAVLEDQKVIASGFINRKITHSQTLLPMVKNVLARSNFSVEELDGIAVSAGPGSFTGIRIGISAVKGLAAPRHLPVVGVSTLRAMAENLTGTNGIICALMDARCNQVYHAFFSSQDGTIKRICNDRAISMEALKIELQSYTASDPVYLIGDGSTLFYEFIQDKKNIFLANEQIRFQNAVGVALAAWQDFCDGTTVSAEELLPIYLRLPQAERELKSKRNKGGI